MDWYSLQLQDAPASVTDVSLTIQFSTNLCVIYLGDAVISVVPIVPILPSFNLCDVTCGFHYLYCLHYSHCRSETIMIPQDLGPAHMYPVTKESYEVYKNVLAMKEGLFQHSLSVTL